MGAVAHVRHTRGVGGDVVGNVHVDLPGGLGGPLPEGDQVLRIGPAVGEFEGEPAGNALWVIEDADGTRVAERLFTFRLKGRGLGGGEHRHGVDADGYLSVDLFSRPGTVAERALQVQLHAEGARWAGEPVQRIGPAIRFAAAWTRGNRLRPRDEFSLNVSNEALPLQAESPIPMTAVEAVEDLIRISTATRRPIGLPGNIIALAQQRGEGLRIIADTVSGLDPLVGIADLVVLHEDDPAAFDDLVARTEAGNAGHSLGHPVRPSGRGLHLLLQPGGHRRRHPRAGRAERIRLGARHEGSPARSDREHARSGGLGPGPGGGPISPASFRRDNAR